MARGTRRIGLQDIQILRPNEVLWDNAVIGFGARRQSGAAITYVLQYRTKDGRQRFLRIGRQGSPWAPNTARNEARRLLGEVANGGDPAARPEVVPSVNDLCDAYLADAEAGRLLTRRKITKRASTLVSDRGRIARHIKPLIGRLSVERVTRDDVERMMHDIAAGITAGRQKTGPHGLSVVRGGRGVASRTVGLLGAIFSYAIHKGIRTDNPTHGVMRFADGRRDRRLADEEYRQLATGLRLAEGGGMWQPAVDVVRMMTLTGWRRGEVLGLQWSEIDLNRRTARLTDTKTGFSMRPLAAAVCNLIRLQKQTGTFVYPTTDGIGQMIGHRKLWLKMIKLAGLPGDVTPHVLRHWYASLAADLGFSEPTIATLLGHKGHSITSRYVHSADAALLAAADAVANKTLVLMAADDVGETPMENGLLVYRASDECVA